MSAKLPFSLSLNAAAPDAHTLLRADFSARPEQDREDPRLVRVGLDLASAPATAEHWRAARAVTHGRDGDFGWSGNDDILFAQLRVDESALADMERAAFDAYARIGAFLQQRGYPHLLRIWNYFHDIHRGAGDTERYRQFVAGRYRALATQPGFEQHLPAATAIGTREPGMLIYFIASKAPGAQIENPRQVSAFEYPAQYGPRSPSFSRATLADAGSEAYLLVSGTASIVGHASQHAGDAKAQLVEIARNLKALQLRAQRQRGGTTEWVPALLKLYLRDPAQLPQLRECLREQFGDAPLLCLEGDICRSDLLVEIEAVYRLAGPA